MKIGTVYLICFEQKLAHAKHYIGFTELPIEKRMQRHQSSSGAKLLQALNTKRLKWHLARTWENVPQSFERLLKNQKNTKRFCPICGQGKDIVCHAL